MNEVHRISGYGHAGLGFRFTGLLPYGAVGYEYGQLMFNEDNVFDGNSIGSAGRITQSGWYWQAGLFVRKWLHVSYRKTWGHEHSDMGTFSIGLNMSAF